jgi:hypothetical protein
VDKIVRRNDENDWRQGSFQTNSATYPGHEKSCQVRVEKWTDTGQGTPATIPVHKKVPWTTAGACDPKKIFTPSIM